MPTTFNLPTSSAQKLNLPSQISLVTAFATAINVVEAITETVSPYILTLFNDVDAATARATLGAGTGSGTVTAVSVATANGVSGSSSGGATPALTITLGAITPTTVNGVTFTGTGTLATGSFTLTVGGTSSVNGTFSGTSSGTNTGDSTAPAQVLTGYTSGAGAVAATDTILQAIQKLNGNTSAIVGANPSAPIGLAAVNGVATTFLRSDGAPALDVSIAPTWTGNHVFATTARSSGVGPYHRIVTPVDTAQTGSTESIGFAIGGTNANPPLTVTRTWAAGAYAGSQRENLFTAPTYNTASASSWAGATLATVAITGAPTIGGNISGSPTPLALWVQAGKARFDGSATINDTSVNALVQTTGLYVKGTGGSANIDAALVLCNTRTTTTTTPQAALVITRQNSTTGVPCWTFAVNGNNQAVLGVNNSSLIIGGGGTAPFTDLDLETIRVQCGTSGNNLVGINTGVTISAQLHVVSGAAATPVLIAKAAASATADIFQAQKSDATVYAAITAIGHTYDAGIQRVTGDVTNATATMTNITGSSWNATTGRKYVGFFVVRASDSQAAEGLAFDVNGGTATFSSVAFSLIGTPIGATIGTADSTALGTALTVTTATTGDIAYLIMFTGVCNGTGTVILRGAQNTHTLGTATFRAGSFVRVNDSPN